jgi:hypothetical protein
LAASDLELHEPTSIRPLNLAFLCRYKDDADVVSGFQNGDGLIGIGCLYRSVARRFHQIDRMEPTKNFILNDKNVGL